MTCTGLSQLQRWLHPPDATRPRYTPDELAAYLDYKQTTSRLRHAAVLIASSLPSLVTSLLAPLVPLQDAQLGAHANAGFFWSFFVAALMMALGSTLQLREAAVVPAEHFTLTDVGMISIVHGGLCTIVMFTAATLWRFPVPFSMTVLFVPLVLAMGTAYVVVLRGRLLRRDGAVRGRLLAALPSFALQASQLTVYPALSALFIVFSTFGQIALVVVFPLIKYGYRVMLRRLTRHLPEDGNEFAVSGVEIAAAMYQSTLMQNNPPAYATALLIGIDVVSLLVSIFVFMARPSTVMPLTTVNPTASLQLATTTPVPKNGSRRLVYPSGSHRESGYPPETVHLLELLHVAESHALIEYFEVSLPAVNAIFISLASLLPSAAYHPKLRVYRHDRDELTTALTNLAIYTLLQTASLVCMHVVVWWRYRVSMTTLLAFLLERHVWSIQGKCIAWLALMLQIPVLHYGASRGLLRLPPIHTETDCLYGPGFDFTFTFQSSLPPLA